MRTRNATTSASRLTALAAAVTAMLIVLAGCGRSAPEEQIAIGSAPSPAADSTAPPASSSESDQAGTDNGDGTGDPMTDALEQMGDSGTDQAATPTPITPPIITPDNNVGLVNQSPDLAGVRITSQNPIVAPTPTTQAPTTTVMTNVNPEMHVVQAGDTLSVIAETYGITTEALAEANNLDDVNTIKPGQELIIPAAN